ncbi:transmembrane channel-like protein 7 [Misgurnus anguillicaudatus]|uniref:transmembrane channel-like protein 7 n=1 Tax=Misgurnus anguillicaudatus TaxID=75329 RepID=UPI003CCFAC79
MTKTKTGRDLVKTKTVCVSRICRVCCVCVLLLTDMMEEKDGISNMQMPLSDESSRSVLSDDSCEIDDHPEIDEELPGSQARLGQHQKPDIQIADVQNERLLMNSAPLKALPVCMQDKKEARKERQERHKIGSWESWRRSRLIAWRRFKEHVSSALTILLPWRHALRIIEGQFGVGIKAYFGFLRYLLGLNLLYCAIISGSVLTPTLLYRNKHENERGS